MGMSNKQSLNLVSWNVNGIRAAYTKGFLSWLETANPDVLALQESKIQAHQMQGDMLEPPGGYNTYWAYAERPGYSGVGLLSKVKPERVLTGLGIERFDSEGRTIIAEYSDFVLFSHYFPNGGQGEHRIQYKLEFYDAFLEKALEYKQQGWAVLATGDFNTAHHAIDLARPKENVNVTGFLPIERAWMDKFTEAGFVDTFRQIHGDKPECYTWWNMRTRARERNVGWRIDYFFVSDNAKERVLDAHIHSEVVGSDHCPVSIEWAVG
jgi:exodeoxyribonuclease III